MIIIYGKPGNYKSTLGVSILNNYSNSCYINLDNNKHLKLKDDIVVFNEVNSIDFIKKCISNYNSILVDYIPLIKINKNELLELKELVKKENKTLIIISSCSSKNELMNNYYNELKEIADLMILTDKLIK